MPVSAFSDPVIQYGFAGACAVLLAFLFWLIRRLLELLEECAGVIAANTDAVESLTTVQQEALGRQNDLRDRLLARPCLRPARD
jgi:hypothetical protein